MRLRALAAIGSAALLASCAAPPPPAPPPPPPPPKPIQAAPPAADWRDLPLAAGEWSWSQGVARFGPADAVLLSVACEAGTIVFTAKGAAAPGSAAGLTFTTSDATFVYPATAGSGGIVARTPASDPNLVKLAFSRGRFAIAAPAAGLQQTLLPVRPEIGRVIDDCRG